MATIDIDTHRPVLGLKFPLHSVKTIADSKFAQKSYRTSTNSSTLSRYDFGRQAAWLRYATFTDE
jgi:hypothetical protein